MQLNSVIFDMDGLLIDSEPLWNEAADEVFRRHGMQLTPEKLCHHHRPAHQGICALVVHQIWY